MAMGIRINTAMAADDNLLIDINQNSSNGQNQTGICINLLYCGLPIMQNLCNSCDKDKPDIDINAGLFIYDVKAKLTQNSNNPNNFTDIEISFRTNKPASGRISYQAGRIYSDKKLTYSTKLTDKQSTFHIIMITKQSDASMYNFRAYAQTQDEKAESERFNFQTLRPYDSLWELITKAVI